MLTCFKGTGKSWDMFPGTPLVLVQHLQAPPYPPKDLTSHRPAQGLGLLWSFPRHLDPCTFRDASFPTSI